MKKISIKWFIVVILVGCASTKTPPKIDLSIFDNLPQNNEEEKL